QVFMRPVNVKVSLGTAVSLLEGVRLGSQIRDAGQLHPVEFGKEDVRSPFQNSGEIALCFPMIDLVTTWIANKIPQIKTFWVLPLWQTRLLRYMRIFAILMAWGPLRKILAHAIR